VGKRTAVHSVEEALLPLGREPLQSSGFEDAAAGARDDFRRGVRRENLEVDQLFRDGRLLGQQHGERAGLLAGEAGGSPGPDRLAVRLASPKSGARASETNKAAADEFAANVLPIIAAMRAEGASLRKAADALNARRILPLAAGHGPQRKSRTFSGVRGKGRSTAGPDPLLPFEVVDVDGCKVTESSRCGQCNIKKFAASK